MGNCMPSWFIDNIIQRCTVNKTQNSWTQIFCTLIELTSSWTLSQPYVKEDHTRIKQPDGTNHKMTPVLTMYLLVSHHCCPHVITATARAIEASGYVQHGHM